MSIKWKKKKKQGDIEILDWRRSFIGIVMTSKCRTPSGKSENIVDKPKQSKEKGNVFCKEKYCDKESQKEEAITATKSKWENYKMIWNKSNDCCIGYME